MIDYIKNAMTSDDWSEPLLQVREMVESMAHTLRPDGDAIPTLFVDGTVPDMKKTMPYCKDMNDDKDVDEAIGQKGMVVICIGDMNEKTKDSVANMMVAAAINCDAVGMTFLHTVWMAPFKVQSVKANPDESEAELEARVIREAEAYQAIHGTPSQQPDRAEKIMLISVYVDGPWDGCKVALADIERSPDKHPVYKDWVLIDSGDGGWIGRFPDAMKQGLKMAANIREAKKCQ